MFALALALTLLFAAAALLSLVAIGVTARRYGRRALALHGALQQCPSGRNFRVRVVEVRARPSARVIAIRPAGSTGAAIRPLAPASGWRAAA